MGYRFEVLHTGVLRHLLSGPHKLKVSAGLLGEPVDSVAEVTLEPRVGNGRTKADLEFHVALEGDEDVRVVVETKVDSNATIGQLKHFHQGVDGEGSWRIVLFAVGYSAFFLPRTLIERWGKGWVSVDAEKWAEILRSLNLTGDPEAYREAVELEAVEQRRCVEKARGTGLGAPDSVRIDSAWGCRVEPARVPRRLFYVG